MPTADEFIAAAWAAAPAFGVAPATIAILSVSENIVCDVTLEDGNRVAMRLHRPGYNSINELESEVQWVEALGHAGVLVPRAVPTVDGNHYVDIAVGGEARQVGVVEWVAGEPVGGPIENDGSAVVSHYRSIGVVAAQIRAHNATWVPPVGFERRRWDAAGLMGENPLWGRFWEAEDLSASQRELFARARIELFAVLSAVSTGPDRFGLIHADLHLGNLMAADDQLTVIDFDDAGFGWFAHELAVSLHPVLDEPWEDDARAALVAGYREVHPLDDEEEKLIDVFLTVRCLMLMGWLDARRDVPHYVHFEALAAQAAAAAERFLG